VRILLRLARRRARVHVPRTGAPGRRARGAHDRGAGTGRSTPRRAGGVPRRRRRPVRLLHPRSRHRGRRPARAQPRSRRRRDPRRARGQPLPLHGVSQDPRRRAPRCRTGRDPDSGCTRARGGERGPGGRPGEGHGRLRVRGRPPRRGHAPRGDPAQPARVRPHPLDRYDPRGGRSRRARRPHGGRRPRPVDLRPRVRGPARARVRRRALRGRAGRARRGRHARGRSQGDRADRRRVRADTTCRRHGAGAGARCTARARVRQRAKARAHRARRSRRRCGRRLGRGVLRDADAGSRRARPRRPRTVASTSAR
jgi:hypothetical protein